MTRKWTNEYLINMTRGELITKWCADLKQEKVDEFDADLSSMLDEMIASYNKTIANLHKECDEMQMNSIRIYGELLRYRFKYVFSY